MRKLLTYFFFSLLMFPLFATNLIDLNKAEIKDLEKLPITERQAKAIYDYRTYNSFFSSVYDLRKIPEINQSTLNKIKPLVIVSHYDDLDEVAQRRKQIYYLIERLGSSEGFQEGVSDIWEDYLMTPRNVNKMNFANLLNMPNVSPIDAAAILKKRALGENISNYRDLRKTPGISHYGATNLKNYIYYHNKNKTNRLYWDYQFKFIDNPYGEDQEGMFKEMMHDQNATVQHKNLTYWGYFDMGHSQPELTNKIRIRYNNQIKFGFLNYTRKGEKNIFETDSEEILKDSKFFLNYQSNPNILGDDQLKFYSGNYRAAFGEGLVLENSDFFSSRKTGYGFSKRISGLTADLSRTDEYALRGGAIQWNNKYFSSSILYSSDKKDAFVYLDENGNPIKDEGKYKVFSYATSTRRFSNNEIKKAEDFFRSEMGGTIKLAPRKNFIDEKIIGGHFSVSPFIGTNLGMTFYNAIYDNAFFEVPDNQADLCNLLIRSQSNFNKYKINDTELMNLYSTKNSKYKRDYRRIIGYNWTTVLNNTSFSGEYAELSVDGSDFKIGDDPKAIILSSYSQFENLYFVTLYRDYDLDFDNPYSNAFAEHHRFDDTLLDKYAHTLTNPLLQDDYINSSQAQAEKGIYIETRYKFSKYLTLNKTYLDIWERKSDHRYTTRFQGELDFRPIYQLSLRLKYKNQVNRYNDDADRSVSKTNETTCKVRTYLSNRDMISLEYRYLSVWFPPYPYLTNNPNPDGDNIAEATTLTHGDYVSADYTHNFTENLKLQGGCILWYGNGVSHWDWEDIEIDFLGEQGTKFWFSFHDKISNNLYLTLKYKIKNYKTKELEFRNWANNSNDPIYVYKNVNRNDTAVRLQLDWKF